MPRRPLLALALVTACTRGAADAPPPLDTPPSEPPAVPAEVAPEPVPEPEPEPPPPPQRWAAEAALTAVKGSKLKPTTIRFTQTEGESTHVVALAPLAGLKPGTYHLVVHEGSECGKNAKGAGAPWPEAMRVDLQVVVTKKQPGALDEPDVAMPLDGDASIIGRTLVVHADKKGQPAAAVACGPIVEAAPDDGDPGDDGDAGDDEPE